MKTDIVLRPFTRAEYHDFFEGYENDPVMDPRPYRYDPTKTDRAFDKMQARSDWYPEYGIFLPDGYPAGCLSLKRIDRENHCCELGIIMQHDGLKNQGFGTQAIQAGIRLAHEQFGVCHIAADTASGNARMQHVLEKLGFKLVERIPYGCDMIDHWEDKLCYVLEVEA
ncbi:MAG: GNAT family N-acetyltransferase [Clostridia bacterium]|nr:GNAT family N-acetyltransferase [Clostridia bacterium]